MTEALGPLTRHPAFGPRSLKTAPCRSSAVYRVSALVGRPVTEFRQWARRPGRQRCPSPLGRPRARSALTLGAGLWGQRVVAVLAAVALAASGCSGGGRDRRGSPVDGVACPDGSVLGCPVRRGCGEHPRERDRPGARLPERSARQGGSLAGRRLVRDRLRLGLTPAPAWWSPVREMCGPSAPLRAPRASCWCRAPTARPCQCSTLRGCTAGRSTRSPASTWSGTGTTKVGWWKSQAGPARLRPSSGTNRVARLLSSWAAGPGPESPSTSTAGSRRLQIAPAPDGRWPTPKAATGCWSASPTVPVPDPTFTYDDKGYLATSVDADGVRTTWSGSVSDGEAVVVAKTPSGATTTWTDRRTDGKRVITVERSGGARVVEAISDDGSSHVVLGDGTEVRRRLEPDPRWEGAVPRLAATTVATPSGRSVTVEQSSEIVVAAETIA